MGAVSAGTDTAAPAVELQSTPEGKIAVLTGHWTLRGLAGRLEPVREALDRSAAARRLAWDLRPVTALDSAGALIIWRAWNRAVPRACRMRERHRRLFDSWARQDRHEPSPAPAPLAPGARLAFALAIPARAGIERGGAWLRVIGNFVLDTGVVLRRPARAPWRELSATIQVAGLRALPITGLVGVLIGVVVAYLSALQLRAFGADQFIVDLLGYAVIRELGPLIGAIIVAGRSGSSMTAQIGAMRLAQELDALSALGLSISLRVIWPRIVALIVIMPLVVLWTILSALAGGIAATQVTLGLGVEYFVTTMPDSIPAVNLWIGLGKAAVFGAAVGLTVAYYGLRIRPNTRDLGTQTTRAVVVSITLVILLDALFAILLQDVGFP